MYRFALCDDEAKDLETLYDALLAFFEKHHLKNFIIDTFFNGNSLLASTNHYDLIFLDICLPDISGSEIAQYYIEHKQGKILYSYHILKLLLKKVTVLMH